MGTSLKVAPVADLLTHFPAHVPTVLINRTPITHMAMDIMLLGDSDTVVQYLCKRLGWTGLASSNIEPASSDTEPKRVGESHLWTFPGAEIEDDKEDEDVEAGDEKQTDIPSVLS